ncbi:beta-1,4-galactosyltransferase 6-like isoform X2 [Glandiceps talaboti]
MKKIFYVIFLTLTGFGCLTTWCFYWIINDPSRAYGVLYRGFSMGQQIRSSFKRLVSTSSVPGNVDILSISNQDFHGLSLPPLQLNKSSICPETRLPGLRGLLDLNMTVCTMKEAENAVFKKQTTAVGDIVSTANKKLSNYMMISNNYYEASINNGLNYTVDNYTYLPGGLWIPKECKPKWKVAIIIPFRDRHEHLPNLLRHLVLMLMKQRLEFGVFVIEQANTDSFNRAMLLNVGFIESLKFNKWDCYIFHDVDHIPENDNNYYGCGLLPRHFVRGVDKYGYWLPTNRTFGGVSGVTREQFIRVNGATNIFWGWGGEDDDLWNRLSFAGYSLSRPVGNVGYYKSMQHYNKGTLSFINRFGLLRKSKERNFYDGLNNIDYDLSGLTIEKLYFNISADVHRIDLNISMENSLVDKYICNNCF